MTQENLYLSSIRVENIGGIELFEAKLGATALVVGKNGAGKTSVLAAIQNCVEGGHDGDLIRHGAEKGVIIMTLSNGAVIKKVINEKGSTLTITTADGGVVKAAATYLKELAPPTSFDPLAFLDADPKERAALLLKNLPLTFERDEVNEALGAPTCTGPVNLQKLNELRDGKYAERTEFNRNVRDLEGTISDLEKTKGPDDGKDWAAERLRLEEEIQANNTAIATAEADIRLEAEESRSAKQQEINDKIAALKSELSVFMTSLDEAVNESIKESTKELEAARTSLSVQLGEARAKDEQRQQSAGTKIAIDQRKKLLDDHIRKEMRLTKVLKALDELKHKKLKELPIEGLDLKMDKKGNPIILIGETPLDKLNRQAQLFMAIQAVSMASGRLPLILCEAAEIDDKNLADLTGATAEAGMQLILARWMNDAPLRVMTAEEYQEALHV